MIDILAAWLFALVIYKMSSGYQIGNLEPDYGRVTTEEEIKRRARCGLSGGGRRETSGYSMCAAQPAQLEMPAALLPAAQSLIGGAREMREGLDTAPVDDPKNEIALKMLQQSREQTALLQIIAVVLVVLAVLYVAMCIEGSLSHMGMGMGMGISGGHSHRGRYCAECGGVV